jgi:acyl-CoA thioester hydrolase
MKRLTTNSAPPRAAVSSGPRTASGLTVRFNEVDAYQIVWHGNYVAYFEEGRRAFGERYGLGYDDFEQRGLLVPIVRLEVDYLRPLRFGDRVTVETSYVVTPTAKVCFRYRITSLDGQRLYCRGYTEQVMLDAATERMIHHKPEWYQNWQARWQSPRHT